jgi:hypothetical protein
MPIGKEKTLPSKPPDISLQTRAAIVMLIRLLKSITSVLEKYLKGEIINV